MTDNIEHHTWGPYDVFSTVESNRPTASAYVINEPDCLFIEQIDSSKKGDGHKVIEEIIHVARKMGKSAVTGVFAPLPKNRKRARKFFEDEGFEFYEENGMTIIRMNI